MIITNISHKAKGPVFGIWSVISRYLWGVEIEGLENLPEKGPFIICPNHQSHLDPWWIISSLPKSYRYSIQALAKRELSETFFGKLLTFNGTLCIYVNREKFDLSTYNKILDTLKQDKVLLIFPEGTRSKTGELGDFKHGVASIAQQAEVPIVPIYIAGAFDVFPPHYKFPALFNWARLRRWKIKMVIGQAIPVTKPVAEKKRAVIELTNTLRSAIEYLSNKVGSVQNIPDSYVLEDNNCQC